MIKFIKCGMIPFSAACSCLLLFILHKLNRALRTFRKKNMMKNYQNNVTGTWAKSKNSTQFNNNNNNWLRELHTEKKLVCDSKLYYTHSNANYQPEEKEKEKTYIRIIKNKMLKLAWHSIHYPQGSNSAP